MIHIRVLILFLFCCIFEVSSQNLSHIPKAENNQSEYNNFIGVLYWLDTFESYFQTGHYTAIEYQRKTKYGNIVSRLGYGNRFGKSDSNFELEAYPRLSKSSYALVELGLGFNNKFFPNHRYGLEYFQIFSKTYEASLGYKNLSFSTRDISIYTASLGKYYKNYWFNARLFLTSSNGSSTNSYAGIVRRYFKDKYNYVSLNISYGIYFEQINVEDAFGTSYRFGFNYQQEIYKKIYLRLAVDYRREELLFSQGNYINMFTGILTLSKRF